ncbi:MAG: outer membrane beta-barrel protein [Kofleriaceae bacterium]|nr:outer membrane beta-barrel protein [Kofleriaceae bacterium]
MLTKEQLLRGSAVLLTLVASTGIAMADDEQASEGSCAPPEGTCPSAPAAQAEPVSPTQNTYVEPQPTYEPRYEEAAAEDPLARYGLEVSLGGGVSGFTSDSARDFTNDGGAWEVNVGIGNRSPLGFEASYIGSAQSIDALGLDENAILVGNGVQGLVRVNFTQDYSLQPFAFAGAAWRHYNLTNTDFNTSDIDDSDDVLEIPMGAGLAFKYQGFTLDARGEFRLASQEDLMPSLTAVDVDDRATMDRWGVNANIGYTF